MLGEWQMLAIVLVAALVVIGAALALVVLTQRTSRAKT